MKFTEHEMTVAVQAVAREIVEASPGADETTWDAMDRFERYQLLSGIGEITLPVLVALPDVDVAAGSRASYDLDVVMAAVRGHDQREDQVPDEVPDEVVVARASFVQRMLATMPVRRDPDAPLSADEIEAQAADFVVPDTLEGL